MGEVARIEYLVARRLKAKRGWRSVEDAFGSAHPDLKARCKAAWPDKDAVLAILAAHVADVDAHHQHIVAATDLAVRGELDPLRQFVVYRMYDAQGILLYVGKTGAVTSRLAAHMRTQPWADQIARVEYIKCVSEQAALAVERYLIEVLTPRHNATYNTGFTAV